MNARVILFKPSGKYYTEEYWVIPQDAVIPADMERSPNFRRIAGGAVLIDTQEPWGYPHLFPSVDIDNVQITLIENELDPTVLDIQAQRSTTLG